MKACGEWMYSSHFLDLVTSWRWVVSFTPLPLYLRRKSPQYPLNRRLGGPQSRSGQCGEEKILDTTGTLPQLLSCPAHSQSLYRLSCPSSSSLSVQKFNTGLHTEIAYYILQCHKLLTCQLFIALLWLCMCVVQLAECRIFLLLQCHYLWVEVWPLAMYNWRFKIAHSSGGKLVPSDQRMVASFTEDKVTTELMAFR
jgi:hypothetical protein